MLLTLEHNGGRHYIIVIYTIDARVSAPGLNEYTCGVQACPVTDTFLLPPTEFGKDEPWRDG